MKMIYLPVKFEFDWTNHFQVRVRKLKFLTDKRNTEKRTDRTTPTLKGT